jgi:DNA-binding transcriptional LysR family regulator
MPKINQLESLKVLKAVVEEGSFTAAAKRLSLSVARISKSIEHLELELNTKLFVRSTRHMQL